MTHTYSHTPTNIRQLPPGLAITMPREDYNAAGPKAVLVTKNLNLDDAVQGNETRLYETDRNTGEKTPMFIPGINGTRTPVYVTTDSNYRGKDSDLIIVDLTRFPLDTFYEEGSELSDIVKQSGPVVGVGRAVVHFPGHPLNGYGDMRFSYLQRVLREAKKLKRN